MVVRSVVRQHWVVFVHLRFTEKLDVRQGQDGDS